MNTSSYITPHLGCKWKMPNNKNERKKGNNKSKALQNGQAY